MDFDCFEKLSTLCRSCLKNTGNNSLFEKDENSNDSISEMLLACTSVTVLPACHGPLGLCIKCLSRLKDSFEFRRQCQDSESRIKELLSKKSDTKPEDLVVNFVDCDGAVGSPEGQYSDAKSQKRIARCNTESTGSTCLIKNEDSHSCDVCSYSTTRRRELIAHIRRHTGEKPYECRTCGKRYPSKASLDIHSKQCCGGCVCEVCGKVYKRLELHRLTHSSQKCHQCSMCAKAFCSRHQLKQHLKSHSKGDRVRRHACQTCSKSFFDARSLSDHIKIHEAVRQLYKCSICQKNFVGKSGLNAHMTRHTIHKKFKCDHCARAFHSKADLASHMMTHLGKRTFECDQCGKCFVRKNSLATHKISHSKTKNYSCNICNQRFARNNSLYDHRKKKHNIQSSRNMEGSFHLDLTLTPGPLI